ncbi:MAG: U32 family peptidase, partial [Acutalibacteraceae bacterium]
MSRFEVLSPVGNGEMLVAACRAGANAVYLGAKEFSARRNAENFDDNALKEAVKYCHIRGVKVYLTLNIQIKDGELSSAVDLARRAYNYGVDGIIIADLGLAAVLHKSIPALNLHASTQMTVHTPAALTILKNAGFTRVVAAREMSREELRELCKRAKELNIEVEVFVHGALCMSVSGQCLLSAFLGSRSGNRGLCAGPCRLPFAVKGGTGYDLSLKDLSLLPHIKELCDMGVTSFKIEGRMKRPEYVAAATAACREALDSGSVPTELENTLKNVFSRSGFTDGYYVNRLGRDMFGIRTKEDVTSADKAFPKIHELYRAERRTVKINAEITVTKDMPVMLTLGDGENRVTVKGDIPKTAQNRPITPESLRAGLDKFGSTPYLLKEIAVECGEGLYVSAAQINSIRREAAELLDEKRGEVRHAQSGVIYTPTERKEKRTAEPKIYARFEDISQIPKNLSGISAVIFPLEKEFDINIDGVELIADIPRGIVSEALIRKRLRSFKEKGFTAAVCGNLSAVQIAKEEGFKIIAGTGLNVL